MTSSDLCFLPATELTRLIRDGEASCREVMEAHLAQIARINPKVNAIVSQRADADVLAEADAADAALKAGNAPGLLHGLPIAYKDTTATKGIRTTLGSPILADNVPDHDALVVERVQGAGAITLGKTNVPEFAAGSHTFNPVFGATLNPYDLGKSAGGSSGGAAVSLACGMLPIADGSDLGGSLRNPGNFNNVVGFRSSPGRVPLWPSPLAWNPLPVAGPLARTVADVALLMQAMAGPEPRAPISVAEPGSVFAQPLGRDFTGVKVAWAPDLGGLPVDPRVRSVLESRRGAFGDLGCVLEEACPDFSGADEVFHVMRAWMFQASWGHLLADNRHRMKETVIWNIEAGEALTGPQLGRAELTRTQIYHRARTFLEDFEFLLCPVNQVPPFPQEVDWVREIDGVPMETYVDWMRSCSYITVTGLPAISVPCGFTTDGLPVGIQIVGRHNADLSVLQLAHAFEQATQVWKQRPPVVR